MSFNFGNLFGKFAAASQVKADADKIKADVAKNNTDAAAVAAALTASVNAVQTIKDWAGPIVIEGNGELAAAFAVLDGDMQGVKQLLDDLAQSSADVRTLQNDVHAVTG